MKTQHTQGEWKIIWQKGDFDIPTSISIQKNINHGTYHEVICDILHGAVNDKEYLERWKNETEANAKLIAAAPITTEELYKTTEYLKSLIKNDCIKGVGTIETIKGIIRTNEQAIKKATE